MRARVLGLSVGASTVTAALVQGTALLWAGSATYAEYPDLAEVIARLAGEAGKPVRRVRVALARDVVQVRTIHPAPPLKPRDVARYVGLEAGRLFRKNGAPLVTSGAFVAITKTDRALWTAATAEPLLAAIIDGCTQAGITVEAMAPSAETLSAALEIPVGTPEITIPNGTGTETLSVGVGGVWRSRWNRGGDPETVAWVTALEAVNGQSAIIAPAYAAGVRLPVLSLFPEGHRAARRRVDRRRVGLVAAMGVALWLLAGAVYMTRLSMAYTRATALLRAFRPAADSALQDRRDLDDGNATLATIASARTHRSQSLRLLGDLTRALPDSVTLVALQVEADGAVRLTGYAPRAAAVLAQVGRTPRLVNATLDGQVTRQVVAGVGERDRFTVVAREAQ